MGITGESLLGTSHMGPPAESPPGPTRDPGRAPRRGSPAAGSSPPTRGSAHPPGRVTGGVWRVSPSTPQRPESPRGFSRGWAAALGASAANCRPGGETVSPSAEPNSAPHCWGGPSHHAEGRGAPVPSAPPSRARAGAAH